MRELLHRTTWPDEVDEMAKRTRGTQGTKRMLELGYKPMQLWLSPSMKARLSEAAAQVDQPASSFALEIIRNELARRAAERMKRL
jgi:hypothetical protein